MTLADILHIIKLGKRVSIEDEFGYHDLTWQNDKIHVDNKPTTLSVVSSWFGIYLDNPNEINAYVHDE